MSRSRMKLARWAVATSIFHYGQVTAAEAITIFLNDQEPLLATFGSGGAQATTGRLGPATVQLKMKG